MTQTSPVLAAAFGAVVSILLVSASATAQGFQWVKTVDEALDYVSLWNAAYLQSNDLGEALAAFVEKRDPKFEGN